MDIQVASMSFAIVNSSMLCDSLDGRRLWGRMDTFMCMAESLLYSSETITTLLVNQLYPSTKQKKIF